jgi:hypothetical protein
MGRKFRASINKSLQQNESESLSEVPKNTSTGTNRATLESDDDTQDIESPTKHQSNSPLLMTTDRKGHEADFQEDAPLSDEESQAFDFDNWAKNQKGNH